jgi:lipoprotein-anchoring transpeptidase ErfK/SrfK
MTVAQTPAPAAASAAAMARAARRGRSATATALLLAALVAGATAGCGGAAGDRATAANDAPAAGATTAPVPAPQSATAQAPASRPPAYERRLVGIERPTALRSRPGGRVVARVGARTRFGSQTVLPVVARRGGWLGVISAALPNGRIGWLPASAPLRPYATDYRIDASLRRRQVVVRRGTHVVARFPVAVGGPGTPTPTGRFAVTDTLLAEDPSGPYGCCVLALSGRQPRTPQGWGGGDRIAIHATDKPGTIGSAASLGCLRAPAGEMRRLIRLVPVGTVVTIRA